MLELLFNSPLGHTVQKIAIFVDVQNIYYTCRDAFNQQFNYRAFWEDIRQQGDIVTANAYAIARNDSKQNAFQTALKHIGFDIKLKPFIQRSDGSAKGDWDVGITIDVLDAADKVDKVILLSGDGDFDLLFSRLKQRGTTTMSIGAKALTAKSLIDASDHFHAIDSRWLK